MDSQRVTSLGSFLWAALLGIGGTALVAGCTTEFGTSGSGGAGATSTTSTTTTGSGGQGLGGAAGGAQGGGGGAVSGENCSNGIDDDGDDLVDCLDPACSGAGFVCLAVPVGWTGPVLMNPAQPPSCPSGWNGPTRSGGLGVSAAPLSCGCSCDDPQSPACPTNVTLRGFSDAGCSQAHWSMDVAEGSCANLTNAGIPAGVSVDKISPSGTCGAGSSSVLLTPEPSFTNPMSLCDNGPQGAGCDTGVCVPPGSGGRHVCIATDGDVPCPSGGLVKQLLFTNFADGRSCGCNCLFTGDCTATASIHGSFDCSGSSVDAISGAGCQAVPLSGGGNESADVQIDGGPFGCQSQPQPHGTVVGAEPVTLCCEP